MKYLQSNFFYILQNKAKKKFTLDSCCQTINSQNTEYDDQAKMKQLQTQVFDNLLKLQKIFEKDIKWKKLQNDIITVFIDIKQSKQLSYNHFEPIQVSITCYYKLNPHRPTQYFKFSNFKGVFDNQQKQLKELEEKYQNRKFGDWTLFYEFFMRTSKILNTIPKFLQKSLLDKRNMENQIQTKIQENYKNQQQNGNLLLEERKTSDKIKHQRIQDMFSKNQHSMNAEDENYSEERQIVPYQFNKRQQTYSRYKNDFEQLQILGRGGFGKVYKVKNRIDGNFYAIKQVKIQESQNKGLLRKMLLEVETLSKLQHHNIVRYYQAWIEHLDDEDDDDDSDDLILDANQNSRSESFSSDVSDSSDSNDFQNQTKKDIYSQSFVVSFGDDVQSNQSKKQKNTIIVLYIQMEYCLQETLKEIIPKLDVRKDAQTINRLFLQIVDALAYIHSQNIIHRDIKPSNIFLDKSWNVKIGDFGLAKIFEKEFLKKSVQGHSNSNKQSFIVGTPIYMSPEQNMGQNTSKSDMYSLGVILFEMIVPIFSTDMQRIKVLTQFQKDLKCPSHLIHVQENELYQIAVGLLQKNPDDRISSKELFTKFQHQLYKQYIISDQAEYENIIDSIFSNREKFQRICPKEMSQENKMQKPSFNIQVIDKLNLIIRMQLKQFFCNKIEILPFIQIFSYLRINRWQYSKNVFEVRNQTVNRMIDLDKFHQEDMYLNYRGDFILSQQENFLRFCKSLENLGLPMGKFYGFDAQNYKQTQLLFANISPDIEESQIYNQIETFKIIDSLLQNFEQFTQDLTCYKSSSILIDALIEKIKLRDVDVQKFYQIIKKFKQYTQTQFYNILKENLPYIKQNGPLIIDFLKIEDTNFDNFITKINKILPNSPLVNFFLKYEKNIIQIQQDIELKRRMFKQNADMQNDEQLKQERRQSGQDSYTFLKNIQFKYTVLPIFDQYFPRFHSGQMFWIVDENNENKDTKDALVYGGRFENIFHCKNQIVNGFVFNFSLLLQQKVFKKKLQEKQLQITQVFSSFSEYNSVLIVSKFKQMLEEKLMVQDLLWQEGMKVKIIYEAINNIKKDSIYSKKFKIQHIIILEPDFNHENQKIKIISLQDGKEKTMELKYCANNLKKSHDKNIFNQN